MEKMLIKGVACDKDVLLISIVGVEDAPGIAFKIFNQLGKNNVNVDIILQSIGRNGKKDITFTAPIGQKNDVKEALDKIADFVSYENIIYNEEIAKVSIVGAGMESHPGIAATMFEALADANVNVNMIATSEIKISVLIKEKDSLAAMNAIHDKFFG